MPANLPPQYVEKEKKLKSAATPEEKITILEELLSIIPKHKGTEKLQAMLKTKMAKFKAMAQKRSGPAKHGPGHSIKRSGAGQVVLVGPPNSGKSLLVKSLTNADPQVSDYPFTTNAPYPAMMEFENIQVQLVDTPPITPDYMEVWHPELIKAADGVILLLDLSTPDSVETLRLILEKLKEKKIGFIEPEGIPAVEEEIPFFYKKALMVANKNDLPQAAENLDAVLKNPGSNLKPIPLSAYTGEGLENLKGSIYSMLDIIRVYSKSPGKKAEFNDPFTLKKGSTVMDMAGVVHKDFTRKLKFARIWSRNKYQGQKVNRQHLLEDGDIIELHT